MAKLQNDFTTIEQSKRLLALGVPYNSANYYYYTEVDKQPKILTTDNFYWARSPYFPCWSAGRLMEIFDICFSIKKGKCPTTTVMTKTSGSVIEYLVCTFEIQPPCKLDFSKLELNN